jgi:serine/threonine protein phosphatase 1
MMMQSRENVDLMWLACGGEETLASYGIAPPEVPDFVIQPLKAWEDIHLDLSVVPTRHWQFLDEECVDWYETEHHFFVHANAYADVPLNEQPLFMLYWEKLYGAVAHDNGKIMVCGHTKQASRRPLNLGTTICIDTGVYEPNGWLTCLDVNSGHYWQANQEGELRTGQLEEPEPS